MELREISVHGFIQEFNEVTRGKHPRKFCFVLGAGASISSGIPSGQLLIQRWDAELRERYGVEAHEQWKKELNICEANKFEHFFDYYEARFPIPLDGYSYMEGIMENTSLSAGHIILAYILCHTDNNIVVTTNYDQLIESAISRYERIFPLVIDHESLTHYVIGNAKRPIVIKIHQNLLWDPDIESHGARWEEDFGTVFVNYHPIFIGFTGNDRLLMDYLLKHKDRFHSGAWKQPYWTIYGNDLLSGRAREFMEAAGGYFIRNCDFDEMMVQMGASLDFRLKSEDELFMEAKKARAIIREKITGVLPQQMPEPIAEMGKMEGRNEAEQSGFLLKEAQIQNQQVPAFIRNNRNVTILHLSDLHFTRNEDMHIMRQAILDEARAKVHDKQRGEKLLIVTGDFHNYHTTNYDDATEFINDLIEAMDIEPACDVFVIPGNHDDANDEMMKKIVKPTIPDWDKHKESAISMLKQKKWDYLNWRLESFIPYCQFVSALGIYPMMADPMDTAPAKVHIRRWRDTLNILHINTCLIAGGTEKSNQLVDILGATDYKLWNKWHRNDIPAIALGHNSFYDLNEAQQLRLESVFGRQNISAWLCGDTHQVNLNPNTQTIPIEAGQSSQVKRIPNIVCVKGVADTEDSYSDFGYYWHEWNMATDKVTLEFRRWRPEYLNQTAAEGIKSEYDMRRRN